MYSPTCLSIHPIQMRMRPMPKQRIQGKTSSVDASPPLDLLPLPAAPPPTPPPPTEFVINVLDKEVVVVVTTTAAVVDNIDEGEEEDGEEAGR